MKSYRNKLQLEQLDRKLKLFSNLAASGTPTDGWIHAIRTSLGMSLNQLAKRMSMTAQSVKELEQREKNYNVTLKNLAEAARILNLRLVYGFAPQTDSLTKQVDRQARRVAEKIVLRTDKTMRLENQGNSTPRLKKAINERAEDLKNKQPRYLWD